jgi:hypothetical protein
VLTEIASATWAAAALLPGIEACHFRYSRSLHPSYLASNSEIIVGRIRDLRHQMWQGLCDGAEPMPLGDAQRGRTGALLFHCLCAKSCKFRDES